MSEKKKAKLYEYEFACIVHGTFDGAVLAANKKDAIKKAERMVRDEGLSVVGKIDIQRD